MAYAATIGFFDGVHQGHQFVISQLVNVARKTGLQAAVVTFSEHPQKVLTGGQLPLLTTFDERIELIKQQRVDEIFAFNFEIIREMTAEEFMRILRNQCGVELLLMGYDHRFGSDRLSRPEEYQAIADRIGMQLVVLPESIVKQGADNIIPSSTKIRKALLSGLIEEANEMLGYAYSLSGEIVEGRHLGRTIGFPTANIAIAEDKLCPANGVYAGSLSDLELGFRDEPVLVNIGSNPTVGGRKVTVEMHIPYWDGDLYGRHMTVSLRRYIRQEKKFPSLDALKEQIHKDMANLQ